MFLPHPSSTPEWAVRFAAVVSFILTVIKWIIGWFSGSLAILGSALDSFMDIFVSLVNAMALSISKRTRTKRFSYWLGKIQGFAALFEGTVVLSSGGWLIYSSIRSYFERIPITIDILEIAIMIGATLWSILIVSNFAHVQKLYPKSLLVQSDRLHYTSDILMNSGVFLSLLATRFLGWWWLDSISAAIIGVVIIYNSSGIFKQALTMLLDGNLSDMEMEKVDAILKSHEAVTSYHDLRSRKSWDAIFLEAHIVFGEKNILLEHAHRISHVLENRLRKEFPNMTVTLHLDTHFDSEEKTDE